MLAYKQFFDVEGDSGLVARACGTACYITPVGKNDSSAVDLGSGLQRSENDDENDSEKNVSKDDLPPILPPVDAIDALTSPRYMPRRFVKSMKPPEAFNISVHDVSAFVLLHGN